MKRIGLPLFLLLCAVPFFAASQWHRGGRPDTGETLVPASGEVDSAHPQGDAPDPTGGLADARSIPAAPTQAQASIEKALPVACSIEGQVASLGRDALAPLAAARLRITDARGESTTARTDGSGAYRFTDLAPGTWWIACEEDRHSSETRRVELTLTDPITRCDYELRPKLRLPIQVLMPDGRSLGEALESMEPPPPRIQIMAVATRDAPGAFVFELRGSSGGVGRFHPGSQLDALPAPYTASLILNEPPPVYVSLLSYQAVLATQRVEPGVEELVFVLTPEQLRDPLATLRLRVVDSVTGDPIADVLPMLLGTAVMPRFDPSAAEGLLVLEGLLPGRHELTLVFLGEGYGFHRQEVLLRPGEMLDLGEVALAPGVSISGIVIDETGASIEATVQPERRGARFGEDNLLDFSRPSGRDGRFEFPSLPAGEHLLTISDAEFGFGAACAFVDARAGAVTDVNLVVRRPSRLVLITPHEGEGIQHFRIDDARGFQVFASRLEGSAPRAFPLAPGNYLLQLLDAAGTEVSVRQFTLTAEPLTLELAR